MRIPVLSKTSDLEKIIRSLTSQGSNKKTRKQRDFSWQKDICWYYHSGINTSSIAWQKLEVRIVTVTRLQGALAVVHSCICSRGRSSMKRALRAVSLPH